MNIKKAILWRVYISFLLVCLLAGGVVVQIFRVQTVKGHYWRQLADSLTTDYKNLDPIRGNIYAQDGSLLATSIPIYEARMDVSRGTIKKEVWNAGVDSLAWCLANYFQDKTPERYKEELILARRRNSRYYLIKRKLSHTQLKELRKFPILRLGQYRGGFIVEQRSSRVLPFQLAQRTIGFKAQDADVLPVGLEGAYDKYLSGKIGKRLMQKVAGGAWIPINAENEVDPKDGQDIITNLDVNFQDVTENALMKALVEHDAHHGCAVVMDVKTGQIRAIANLTRDEEGVYSEQYNYALGESAEPGSTFKLVSLLAMLEQGSITPNTTVDTKGGETTFFDRVMRDAEKGGYGVIPLQKAFAHSSNVGISTLAYQAFGRAPSKFTDYIAKLKLNKPLGLSIPGEGIPVFKTPRNRDWNGTTLPWMSIGYELRMTPLQTLTLYNSIANNGRMVKPQFVKEIREVGNLVREFKPETIVPEICTQKTLHQVQDILLSVVEEGTAKNIKNDQYKIAGKTGTAQVANELGSYQEQRLYQASFVGYFPATNPMYSIIVVINNPSKGVYYGGSVAAPVFKEIADKIYSMTATTRSYMAYFDNRPDEPLPFVDVIHSEDLRNLMAYTNIQPPSFDENESWLSIKQEKSKVKAKDYGYSKLKVPDVKGLVLADALYILENSGLRVKFNGRGRVKEQSIEPGSRFLQDETINIELN